MEVDWSKIAFILCLWKPSACFGRESTDNMARCSSPVLRLTRGLMLHCMSLQAKSNPAFKFKFLHLKLNVTRENIMFLWLFCAAFSCNSMSVWAYCLMDILFHVPRYELSLLYDCIKIVEVFRSYEPLFHFLLCFSLLGHLLATSVR